MTLPQRTRLTRIIDGDTVVTQRTRFLIFKQKPLRIRLYGIDAPESEQKGGTESTNTLKRIARRHSSQIYLTKIAIDQYGRTVGILSSSDDDPQDHYNLQMLLAGQAHCYMLNGPFKAEYEAAERVAKSQRLGVWEAEVFDRPADFRRRQEASQQRPLKIPWRILALAAVALVLLFAYNNYWDHLSSSLTAWWREASHVIRSYWPF